jgi:hypothetical protein
MIYYANSLLAGGPKFTAGQVSPAVSTPTPKIMLSPLWRGAFRACSLVVLAAFANSVSAQTESLYNNVAGARQTRDTGNYIVQVDLNASASGWGQLKYGGGDLINRWITAEWNLSAGQAWISVQKSSRAGSVGYPKYVDSIVGPKWVTYGMSRTYGSSKVLAGMYVWLDDNNTGIGTHELNIWNIHVGADMDSSWTFIGDYGIDDSNYRVYRKWNTDNPSFSFWSWQIRRTSQKWGMNYELKGLLTWLRARGLPNHFLINIQPAVEGYGPGSGGVHYNNINIPNL